jgi:hypothetical protein
MWHFLQGQQNEILIIVPKIVTAFVKGETIKQNKGNVCTVESITQEGYRNYRFAPADFLRTARGERERIPSAYH